MSTPKPGQAKQGQSPDAKTGPSAWIRFNRSPGQAPAAKPGQAPAAKPGQAPDKPGQAPAKPGQAPAKPGQAPAKPDDIAIPSAKSIQSFERLMARQRAKLRGKYKQSLYRRVLESDVSEYMAFKFFFHFPFGLIIGYGLYKITLDRLQFDPDFAVPLALVFILSYAFSFSMFVLFRCVALLCFPYMFGEMGRMYIYLITCAFVLTGPVANIFLNLGEVIRSIGCNFEIFVNMTTTRIGIRIIPLIDVLIDLLKSQLEMVNSAMNFVDNFIPIQKELTLKEDDKNRVQDEMQDNEFRLQHNSKIQAIETKYRSTGQMSYLKRRQKEYQEKLELQCEEILSMGVRGCALSMGNAYKRCMRKLSFFGYIICWPCKLTFFCNIFKLINNLAGLSCDATKIVPNTLEGQIDTVDKLSADMDKQFEANMQYEGEETDDPQKIMEASVEALNKNSLWQFNIKRDVFTLAFQVVQRVCVLIFIFIVYRAQEYHNFYLNAIDFDNNSISNYFEHVDKRRRKEVKRTLLPLKKLELKEITTTFSISLTNEEKRQMISGIARGGFMIVFCLVIIVVDFLFREAMILVAGAIKLEYTQQGRHYIACNITGTGALAKLLRKLFQGFNKTYDLANVVTNIKCLPKPSSLNTNDTIWMLVCLGIVMVSAFIEVPVMRFRRYICDFFYRKRQKTRGLYLYNKMLRRRVGYLHEARHIVRKHCKRNTFYLSLSFLTSLRYQFPGYFEWLRYFGLGKQQCLICGEPERGSFIHCPTFQCRATYCRQCWIDVQARCYACRDDDDWTIVSSGGGSAGQRENDPIW